MITSVILFSTLQNQILSTRLGINKFKETACYLRKLTFYKEILIYKNIIKNINLVLKKAIVTLAPIRKSNNEMHSLIYLLQLYLDTLT